MIDFIEPNLNECIDRLKNYFNISTDKELAAILGLTAANLSNYKNGKDRAFPYKWLVSVADKIDKSIDWVLYGKEPEIIKFREGTEFDRLYIRYNSKNDYCDSDRWFIHTDFDQVVVDHKILPIEVNLFTDDYLRAEGFIQDTSADRKRSYCLGIARSYIIKNPNVNVWVHRLFTDDGPYFSIKDIYRIIADIKPVSNSDAYSAVSLEARWCIYAILSQLRINFKAYCQENNLNISGM